MQGKTANAFRRKILPIYESLPFVLTLLLGTVLGIYSRIEPIVNTEFLETQINIFGIQSTRNQFIFYAFLTSTFLLFSIALLFTLSSKTHYQNNLSDDYSPKAKTLLNYLIPIIILLVIGGGVFRVPLAVTCFIALIINFLTIPSIFKLSRVLSFASYGVFIPYIVLCYIVPVFFQYPISNVDNLISYEFHHAATIIPGVEAIKGIHLPDPSTFYYGFLIPFLTKGFALIGGINIINELTTIKVVQFFNIIASALAFGCVYISCQRGFRWLSLLTLPLLPSLSLSHKAISHPNQSGIRYFSLFVALLLLSWIDRLTNKGKYILVLSVFSGLSLALNIELGVVIFFGFFAYIITQSFLDKYTAKGYLWITICFLLLVISSYLLSSLILVKLFTNSSTITQISPFFTLMGVKGYGGISSWPSVLALAAFFIAIVNLTNTVLLGFIDNGLNSEKFINPFSIALSIMILAWMPYYINKQGDWNLWFFPFFVFLLLISNFRQTSLQGLSPAKNHWFLSSGVIAIFLLISVYSYNYKEGLSYSKKFIYDAAHNQCKLIVPFSASTPCYDQSITKRLSTLDPYLQEINNKSDYWVFSPFHETTLRLNGFNEGYPWYIHTGAITKKDMRLRSLFIDQHGPKYLLFPSLSSQDSAYALEHLRHSDYLLESISEYTYQENHDGWRIYRRRA